MDTQSSSLCLAYILVSCLPYLFNILLLHLVCEYAKRGVMAYVGPMSSTPTKAVAPLAEALKLPQLAPVATNPQLGKYTILLTEHTEY